MKRGKRQLFIVRRQLGGSGGAERVAVDFAERFGTDWETELIHAGKVVDGVRIGGCRGPRWWRSLRFAGQVNKLVAKVKPDVVLSLERGPVCDIYRAGDGVSRRWLEIRYGRSCQWMLNPTNWVSSFLEKKTVLSAGLIAANSEMVARDMRGAYPRERDKIKVIRNGFEPTRFHPGSSDALECFDLPESSRIILFLGSGWERKGLSHALLFFAELCRRDSAWREHGVLVVAGKGKPRRYQRKADGLGVGRQVRFLGTVSSPENLCRLAELMVLPTSYDPFSNATLEALACGCPVLTSENNGASEVVDDGCTGLLFPSLDEIGAICAAEAFLTASLKDRQEVAASVVGLTREAEINRYCELLDETIVAERRW